MQNQLRMIFFRLAATILILTAAAKIATLASGLKLLSLPDPLFTFVTRGQLLALASIAEIAIAIAILRRPSDASFSKPALVAWLATVFGLYRFGLYVTGYRGVCPCLGNFGDLFHLNAATVDFLMKGIVVVLLVFSYTFLILDRSSAARKESSRT